MYVTSKTLCCSQGQLDNVLCYWCVIMSCDMVHVLVKHCCSQGQQEAPHGFSPHGETGGQKDRGNDQALRERCRNDSWDGNSNSDVVRQDCRHSTAQILA